MRLLLALFISTTIYALEIIQKPIDFDANRVALTKEYIKEHYGLSVDDIKIIPKIVVIHHTATDSFEHSFWLFNNQTLPDFRSDISNASSLGVSAHFLVDRDGTIYQLMDDNIMARHVIGLNYSAIGIENVGGYKSADNLTQEQLEANIKLVKYLQNRYKTIEYLIGHYEYRDFEDSDLWLEIDDGYRTTKDDPSPRFMKLLREAVDDLKGSFNRL